MKGWEIRKKDENSFVIKIGKLIELLHNELMEWFTIFLVIDN